MDFFDGGELGGILGDDPFPAVVVRDVVFFAEGVELVFACDAEFGF